jgi:hypothetical protein
MWYFADLKFADPISFVACDSASPQTHTFSPYTVNIAEMLKNPFKTFGTVLRQSCAAFCRNF